MRSLLLIASAGIYFQSKLSSQSSKYSIVTGKGFRPRPFDLGAWRVPAVILIVLYMVLPFLVLLRSSLNKYYSVPSFAALDWLSFDTYAKVIDYRLADTDGISLRKGHILLTNLTASVEVPLALTTYLYKVDQMNKDGAPIKSLQLGASVARVNDFGVAKTAGHPNAASRRPIPGSSRCGTILISRSSMAPPCSTGSPSGARPSTRPSSKVLH